LAKIRVLTNNSNYFTPYLKYPPEAKWGLFSNVSVNVGATSGIGSGIGIDSLAVYSHSDKLAF